MIRTAEEETPDGPGGPGGPTSPLGPGGPAGPGSPFLASGSFPQATRMAVKATTIRARYNLKTFQMRPGRAGTVTAIYEKCHPGLTLSVGSVPTSRLGARAQQQGPRAAPRQARTISGRSRCGRPTTGPRSASVTVRWPSIPSQPAITPASWQRFAAIQP
jgi:hypothetical protein